MTSQDSVAKPSSLSSEQIAELRLIAPKLRELSQVMSGGSTKKELRLVADALPSLLEAAQERDELLVKVERLERIEEAAGDVLKLEQAALDKRMSPETFKYTMPKLMDILASALNQEVTPDA